jgi:TatD DNase family protein
MTPTDFMLIDTHCHLYLEDFAAELAEIVLRAEKEGIRRIYMPALDSVHHQAVLDAEARYPELCRAMMGLHPCYVNEGWENELRIIREHAAGRRFAAIGEIGLDYYRDKTFVDEQKRAFEEQMELAASLKLPVVIHSRESMSDTIAMLQARKGRGLYGIFHCFSGTLADANKIIDCGLKLGIGGVVTYKKAGLAEVVAGLDLRDIVLETDAPYLTPVPFRGRRNEPSYLRYVAEKIALIRNVSVEEVARITTANAIQVFGNDL